MSLREVLFQKHPSWKVGEHTEERDGRMRSGVPARSSECWPGNYGGRVTSSRAVADVKSGKLPSLRNMSDKDHPVVVLDLDDDGVEAVASHEWKIVDGRPEPIIFDDRFGAVASKLRERHADPEAWERDENTRVETEEAENKQRRKGNERDAEEYRVRKEDFPRELHQWSMTATDKDIPPAWPERPKPDRLLEVSPSRFDEEVASLTRTLAPTVTHTGTGLYATKVTPTHNDDTQSGAPAGQVITLVTGDLGILDAFKGGYVYNATRGELRAIVSHTDGTVTLEGDLSAWLTTDDLDVYDAWSTIQAEHDQLVTDQGTADFTTKQELRLYDGTFIENVVFSLTLRPTGKHEFVIRANTGDLVTVAGGNGNCFANMGLQGRTLVEDITFTSGSSSGYSGIVCLVANKVQGMEVRRCVFNCGRGIRVLTPLGPVVIEDCTFNISFDYGLLMNTGIVTAKGCVFTDCPTAGISIGRGALSADACKFDSCVRGISVTSGDNTYTQLVVQNCSFFGMTVADVLAEYTEAGTQNTLGYFRALNNVHHTSACVYWISTATTFDHVDRNCIYNATKVARVDETDYTTLANWQAYTDDQGTSPDANSIDSDPLLTDPANGDFSLATGSPCIRATPSAGVVNDVNGDPFAADRVDMGAVSSGTSSAPPSITSASRSGGNIVATVSVGGAPNVRVRLAARSGAQEDEDQRLGGGSITLTPTSSGDHTLIAWGCDATGSPIGEPSFPVLVSIPASVSGSGGSILRHMPHTVTIKRPTITRDADTNVATLDYTNPSMTFSVKCLFQTRGGTIVSTDEGGLIPFDAMLYTGETNIEVNDRVEVAISFFTGNFKVVGVQPKGKLRGRYTHNEVVLQKDGVR